MKKIIPAILCLTLLGFGSCQKKLEEIANKASSQGSLTANAGGKSYTAPSVKASIVSKSLWIRGSDAGSDESMDINLDNYSTSKTKYTIGFITNAANYNDDKDKNHHAVYGEVVLETAGDKNAKGTFSFTTEDSMKVNGGNFNVSWE